MTFEKGWIFLTQNFSDETTGPQWSMKLVSINSSGKTVTPHGSLTAKRPLKSYQTPPNRKGSIELVFLSHEIFSGTIQGNSSNKKKKLGPTNSGKSFGIFFIFRDLRIPRFHEHFNTLVWVGVKLLDNKEVLKATNSVSTQVESLTKGIF